MAKFRTTNAVTILHEMFVRNDPEMQAELELARERLRLAEQLREQEGLSQQDVVTRADTQRSIIARLEQPGYGRHTVSTLRRVAGAMGYVMRVEFDPMGAPVAKGKKAVAKGSKAKASAG